MAPSANTIKNMPDYHLFIDMETFGTDVSTCPVIDCSYVVVAGEELVNGTCTFDNVVKNAVRDKLDVKEQVDKYNYKPEKDTVDWWAQQNKAVRDQIVPSKNDLPLKQFASNILEYVKEYEKIKYVWCRGMNFDIVILRRILRDCNLLAEFDQVAPFWTYRDTRTFIEGAMGLDFNNKFLPVEVEEFNKHDSTHDIAMDVLRIQAIMEAE